MSKANIFNPINKFNYVKGIGSVQAKMLKFRISLYFHELFILFCADFLEVDVNHPKDKILPSFVL